MMEWYQLLSYFVTNSIRCFLGLYLVSHVLSFRRDFRWTSVVSAGIAVIVTALQICSASEMEVIGMEILLLGIAVYFLFREQIRMSLFLIFFYEIAVGLWKFIISCMFAMAFYDSKAPEHLLAVWTVRLLMLGILLFSKNRSEKRKKHEKADLFRPASMIAVAGMICVVSLGSQKRIPIDEDVLSTWNIFSVILMFSVLFFNMNRQYESEKEIARLKEGQAELLERDYQNLNRTYSENAKLFHDLHNHLAILHRYLSRGNANEALQYLEDLRAPVQEIMQSGWTGDDAIDYLISNKIAYAKEQHVSTKVNIEFPRHTNIRSADLTAILGNLLDNALEAIKSVPENQRFINLTIRRINNMLVIKVENGCETVPLLKQGELLSTKQESGLHGWGLKSVRAAAEKYDGIVENTYEEKVFRVVVTLSFEAVKIE